MEIITTKDELLCMLATNLETYTTSHTIGDAKKDTTSLGNDVPSNSSCYNDDTLSQFLIEYKIDYLHEKHIIPWKVASELKDLTKNKFKNEEAFVALAKKGFKKLTPKERAKMNQLYQEN